MYSVQCFPFPHHLNQWQRQVEYCFFAQVQVHLWTATKSSIIFQSSIYFESLDRIRQAHSLISHHWDSSLEIFILLLAWRIVWAVPRFWLKKKKKWYYDVFVLQFDVLKILLAVVSSPRRSTCLEWNWSALNRSDRFKVNLEKCNYLLFFWIKLAVSVVAKAIDRNMRGGWRNHLWMF